MCTITETGAVYMFYAYKLNKINVNNIKFLILIHIMQRYQHSNRLLQLTHHWMFFTNNITHHK